MTTTRGNGGARCAMRTARERIMRPRHLIFATGVSGIPHTRRASRPRRVRRHGRALRRLHERRGVEGPQGAGARHRQQRPRRRAGPARAAARDVTIDPAQHDLCGQREAGAELSTRSTTKASRSRIATCSRPPLPYPVLQRSYQLSTAQGARSRQGRCSTGSQRAASGWTTARTRPGCR